MLKTSNYLLICLILASPFYSPTLLLAQKYDKDWLEEKADEYARASFDELFEMYSLPNDANFKDDIVKNIEWCEGAFARRGFKTTRLETGHIPLLLAERSVANADKTVLIYLQVDGQPVDSSFWNQPSPWIPTLKEQRGNNWEAIPWDRLEGELNMDWRIFVRSASDAKGPVMMFLKSMDIINDASITPNFNMKVIMDFEEELGSPRLPQAVIDYKEQLDSDMLIIFDGPRHVTNKPTLTFGARGIATVTLEVFGPRVPQHSGHYGNYAPNPALKLSQLLASMKDAYGRVTIPKWYDGIELTDEIKEILKLVPDDEADIRKKVGIASIDSVAGNYQESIQYPSLNIRGLRSGWVGKEVRTIVPSSAISEIDIRLVKETTGDQMVSLLRQHIEDQGYYLVEGEPTEEERMKYPNIIRFNSEVSYGAFRTEFDTEVGRWLIKALTRGFDEAPILKRTSGGSIPISPFVITLGIPAVTVPTVNPDNNQHSPNENIRLGNYFEGIRTITAILTEKL